MIQIQSTSTSKIIYLDMISVIAYTTRLGFEILLKCFVTVEYLFRYIEINYNTTILINFTGS